MIPQAEAPIARARRDLDEAKLLATTVRLPLLEAGSAYNAAFHAAEALIAERMGRRAKTHRGVHSEFSRLVKDGTERDRRLARVLLDRYRYKELAD